NGLLIDVEGAASVSPDSATSGGTAVVVGKDGGSVGAGVDGASELAGVVVGVAVGSGAATVVAVTGEVGLASASAAPPQPASIAAVAVSTANAGATRRNAGRGRDMGSVEQKRFAECIFIRPLQPVTCVQLRANVVPVFTTPTPEWKHRCRRTQ